MSFIKHARHTKDEEKKSKKFLIIILILLFLVGSLTTAYIYIRNTGGSITLPGGTQLQLDPNAGQYVAPEQDTSSTPGVAIPGWGRIEIPTGATNVAVNFPNPSANEGNYYLSFELHLKDTGEVLATTGIVPAGQSITRITLSRALPAGEYPAIVHVQPYKTDEAQTPTNNADMETTLIVK